MEPIKFPQANMVYAENQPPFLPLPCYRNKEETISCWKLTPEELAKVAETGILWLRQVNFMAPLQAQSPSVDNPFIDVKTPKGLPNDPRNN